MIYWLVCYLLVCLIFSIQLTLRRGIFVETQIIFPIKVYTAGLSLPLSLNKYYKHFGNLPLKTLKTFKTLKTSKTLKSLKTLKTLKTAKTLKTLKTLKTSKTLKTFKTFKNRIYRKFYFVSLKKYFRKNSCR